VTIASYTALRQDLAADFKAAIAVPYNLAVQWENAPFVEPEGAIAWIAWNVLTAEEQEVARGYPQNLWRCTGIMKVRLFAPIEHGIGNLLALADLIADRYRGSTIGAVQFLGIEIKGAEGRREDDSWVVIVDCIFYADRKA